MHEFSYDTRPRRLDKDTVVVAEVRFDNCCRNPEPSFAITGGLYGREICRGEPTIIFDKHVHWLWGCGCAHKEVADAFPELAPYLQWHLCSPSSPMHYIANGLYWHKLWGDSIAGPPWDEDEYVKRFGTDQLREHFCSTIVFTPGEADLEEIVCWDAEELTQWLQARAPRIQAEFETAMQEVYALKETLA